MDQKDILILKLKIANAELAAELLQRKLNEAIAAGQTLAAELAAELTNENHNGNRQ